MQQCRIHGILWVMRLDERTIRILTILVEEDLRGRGYASSAWEMLVRRARQEGVGDVSLEVRCENDLAYEFYLRRGLDVKGRLSNYYRNGVGIAMHGPLIGYNAQRT